MSVGPHDCNAMPSFRRNFRNGLPAARAGFELLRRRSLIMSGRNLLLNICNFGRGRRSSMIFWLTWTCFQVKFQQMVPVLFGPCLPWWLDARYEQPWQPLRRSKGCARTGPSNPKIHVLNDFRIFLHIIDMKDFFNRCWTDASTFCRRA